MTLIEFLLARIAEDEEAARSAQGPSAFAALETAAEEVITMGDQEGVAEAGTRYFERWMPARVLAECEAKRLILAEVSRKGPGWDPPEDWYDEADNSEPILRMLALPYADHPDFDPAWRITAV